MKYHWKDQPISNDTLKHASVRGGLMALATQLMKFIINTFVTVLLAHLLVPGDFGLIAMVMVVVNFLALFKDAGFSVATVQQTMVTHAQLSLLFWLNTMVGVLLGLILYLATPLIVIFFHEPRLLQITPALAWVFVIGGLGVQHEALMRRQMRFRGLMLAELVGLFAGAVLAVFLAYAGQGYWAMVWMQVATIAVRVMLLWIVSGWLPSLPALKVGARQMVVFGSTLTLANAIHYLSRQSDQWMLGRWHGAHALGLYSMAMQMLMLPIRQILAPLAPVAQVALSRVQDDPTGFRRVFCLLLMLVGYASMPLMALMVVLAEPLVSVALGEQWLEAVPLVRILAATGWILAVNNTMGWVFAARGQGRRMLLWNLIMVPLLLVGFALGIQWGAEGVAWSFFVVIYGSRIPHFLYVLQGSGVSLHDMWLALRAPAGLSIVMACAVALLMSMASDLLAWQQLLLALSMVSLTLWLVVEGWLPVRRDMQKIWQLLKETRT